MNENLVKIFSKRLREALDSSGFTRKEFALRVGSTESTVQKWLSSSNQPSLATIGDIAKTLGVSSTWLVGAESQGQELARLRVIEKVFELKSDSYLAHIGSYLDKLIEEEEEALITRPPEGFDTFWRIRARDAAQALVDDISEIANEEAMQAILETVEAMALEARRNEKLDAN